MIQFSVLFCEVGQTLQVLYPSLKIFLLFFSDHLTTWRKLLNDHNLLHTLYHRKLYQIHLTTNGNQTHNCRSELHLFHRQMNVKLYYFTFTTALILFLYVVDIKSMTGIKEELLTLKNRLILLRLKMAGWIQILIISFQITWKKIRI